MDSRKNKAELIAELGELRQRLENLERSGSQAPLVHPASIEKTEQYARRDGLQSQHILAAIPHAIAKIDLAGRILYANSAYHELFEYEDGALIGTSIINRMETDESQKLLTGVLTMLRNDQPLETSHAQTILTKTGRKIDIQANFGYDRDSEGNLISLTYVVTDSINRKRTEDALRESKWWLDLVLDANNDGTWDWNIRTGEVLFSPSWIRSLGYSEKDIVPHVSSWEELVHPDDMPQLQTCLQKHLDGETSFYRFENRLRMKNGDYRWNLDKGKVVEWDNDGAPLRMVGVYIDITEHKRAGTALQDGRALLDSYIATAPIGMAVFDSDLRYTNVNQSLADINGMSIESHINKRPRDILPGSLGRDVEKKYRNLLQTRLPIIHEDISGETLSEPGVIRHWLHSYFLILGAKQEPKGIGVTVVETTRLKHAEEQLRQSQKMEALGTLSGGIAHDLNNFLYPIFIYANLLLEECDADSEAYADLKEIVSAAQRAKDLVSQVLMFGSHGENVKRICDIVPIIREGISLVRAGLPSNISFENDFTDEVLPVFCDSTQIYQVLVNVCTNAGQSISGSGKIAISMDSSEVDGVVCANGKEIHGSYCRLTVTDSGVGMDDETEAKIFDPFFSAQENGKGLGLGLSTVFRIVEEHEGGIRVSSRLGTGTTFEIFLPIAEGPVTELSETRDSLQIYAGTENILFVDDEASNRKLGQDCLERFGYTVTAVSNGQQAIDVFAVDPDYFNLVVTDQTMPGMTGEELASALLELRPDIPIIICTGHGLATTPASSGTPGISARLQKPLAPTQLMRVVREELDLVGSRAGAVTR